MEMIVFMVEGRVHEDESYTEVVNLTLQALENFKKLYYNKKELKSLFSHFFVVPQKVL